MDAKERPLIATCIPHQKRPTTTTRVVVFTTFTTQTADNGTSNTETIESTYSYVVVSDNLPRDTAYVVLPEKEQPEPYLPEPPRETQWQASPVTILEPQSVVDERPVTQRLARPPPVETPRDSRRLTPNP